VTLQRAYLNLSKSTYHLSLYLDDRTLADAAFHKANKVRQQKRATVAQVEHFVSHRAVDGTNDTYRQAYENNHK
jgi:hypothetical protein